MSNYSRRRGLICGLIGHKPDPLDRAVQMRIRMIYPHDIPNSSNEMTGVLCLRCDVVLPPKAVS